MCVPESMPYIDIDDYENSDGFSILVCAGYRKYRFRFCIDLGSIYIYRSISRSQFMDETSQMEYNMKPSKMIIRQG
jgi:hypothetical protein